MKNKKQWSFYPNAKIFSNNTEMLMNAALNGSGILLFPDWQIGEFLNSGQFTELLPALEASYNTINQYVHFLYPNSKYQSLNTRIVIDSIIKTIGDPPYWRYTKSLKMSNTQI